MAGLSPLYEQALEEQKMIVKSRIQQCQEQNRTRTGPGKRVCDLSTGILWGGSPSQPPAPVNNATPPAKPIISEEVRAYVLAQAEEQGKRDFEELLEKVYGQGNLVRELRGTFDPIKGKYVSKYDQTEDGK